MTFIEKPRVRQMQKLKSTARCNNSVSRSYRKPTRTCRRRSTIWSENINTGDEDSRVEALRERKELKSEYEELDETLNELRERRDSGFPDRQREIRERHSLDVQVTPVTLTEVEYERGEIDFKLIDGSRHQTVTLGYGSGIGVADTVRCSS